MNAEFQKLVENESEAARASNRLLHDLRSPLINIRGFSSELQKAFTHLNAQLAEHKAEIPDEFLINTSKLIEEDIQPCLDFIEEAVAKAYENLNTFSARLAEAAEKQ